MAHILVVDDEPKMRHILRIMLQLRGHTVDEAENGLQALEMAARQPYGLVIADIRMPGLSGLELIDRLKQSGVLAPVIIMTAYATVDSAVDAMKRGAIDYITKPFEESRMIVTVEKAVGIARIIFENQALKKQLQQAGSGQRLICASPAFAKILLLAKKVAIKAGTTVLITGESGVGKEVVARYIHSESPVASEKFVAVNCAAISPGLIESTLFGHEKGAFTGADQRRIGVFEFAGNGTIFLDEIGDLPLEAQAKLLRTLQEKVIQRVGGNQEIRVAARVVCATNQDLETLVSKGKFRSDLFYRINVFPLHIPPLRERKEDIIPLAAFFIKKFHAGASLPDPMLTSGAEKILLHYNWPGNVRELANAMERAVILADDKPIGVEDVGFLQPAPSAVHHDPISFSLPDDGINLEELEKRLIRQALEKCGGNQSAAARLLGLTRSKLRTRVKQLGKEQ